MYKCLNPRTVGITLEWEVCLPLAKDYGFEGIDLPIDPNVPASHYRESLDYYGLKPGGMGLNFHMSHDEPKVAEAITKLPSICERAQEVGQTRFYTWIFPYSDQLPWVDNFRAHVQRLGKAARILDEYGCRLGLEFLGPKTERIGRKYSFVHSMEAMLELAEAIGPNVGLLLDAWHWHTSLGTVGELYNLENNQVVYVHVNDAPAGIPVEQQQDLVRRMPGDTGVIDIAGFLGALRQIGYDGPVVPEPFVAELGTLAPEITTRRVGEAMQHVWVSTPRPPLPTTMKAVATGNSKAWLVDLPVPKPEGNQVIVKIHASPICGSNMGTFYGDGEWINVGHEGAGEVVAVAQSNLLKVGDRVALAPLNACGVCGYCQSGDGIFCQDRPQIHGNFAQYTKISDSLCVVLPDDIDYDRGSLLGCCLGPAFSAVGRLDVKATDTVVVAGLGPVGLGAVALCAFFGAETVTLDPEPYRRELAARLGAHYSFDPTDGQVHSNLVDATQGRGVLKAIECSGVAESQRLLIDEAAVHASIAFVGENQGTIPVSPSKDFIRKGLAVIGCWHMNVLDTPNIFSFLRRKRDAAELLISHRFGFDEVQQAFEVFASRKTSKVLLKPWG